MYGRNDKEYYLCRRNNGFAMGLFDFFSRKDNKKDLDKGLEKTKEGVFSKLAARSQANRRSTTKCSTTWRRC